MATPAAVPVSAAEASLERGLQQLNTNALDAAELSFIEAAASAPTRSLLQARAFGNLANVFTRRGDHRQALAFCEKALPIFREVDVERASVCLITMGRAAEKVSSLEDAVKYMSEAASLTSDATRRAEAQRWLTAHADRLAAGARTLAADKQGATLSAAASARRSMLALDAPAAVPLTAFTQPAVIDARTGLAPPPSKVKLAPAPVSAEGDEEEEDDDEPGGPVQVMKSSSITTSTPAPAAASHVTIMLEYGFENMWFGDVLARMERGFSVLDGVDAALRTRASASEMYARNMAESGSMCNSILVSTGEGIGPFMHGVKPPSSTSTVATAVRSAWSSLMGGSMGDGSEHASSPPAHAEEPQQHVTSVLTGGYDTLMTAIAATRRSYIRDAAGHHRLASALRDLSQQLQAFKSAHTAKTQRLISRGMDFIRATQQAMNNLKRANQQLERARKELEDAAERLSAALEHAGAVPESDLLRRQRRYADATTTARAGEDAVRDAADAIVASRKHRDDELTGISRQLQRLDEERHVTAARIVRTLAQVTSATCEASAEASQRALSLAEAVDVASDVRTFIHQRRVAIMLEEYHARHGVHALGAPAGTPGASARGRAVSSMGLDPDALVRTTASLDPDDAVRVLPSPLAVSTILKHHRDYLATESELAPVMFRWVVHLAEGRGCESLRGERITLDGSVNAAPEPATEGAASPTAAPSEETCFEVSLLEQHAARHAFLRALSARRAQQQLLTEGAFKRMVRVFWWILDACAAQEDARGAQTVLILAETYFRRADGAATSGAAAATGTAPAAGISDSSSLRGSEGGDWVKVADGGDAASTSPRALSDDARAVPDAAGGAGAKEYVQGFIKTHPIWKADFWQESFFRAVRDEIAKIIDPQSASNSRLTVIFAATDADMAAERVASEGGTPTASDAVSPRVRGVISPGAPATSGYSLSTETDTQYTYTQVLFGQLMALAVNMLSFGMPKEEVESIVLRLSSCNGLPRDSVDMLRETIATHV